MGPRDRPGANILLIEDADDPYITASTPQSQITTYKDDVLECVNTATSTPGVVAVSMSFVLPEDSSDVGNNSQFTTPSGHVGIEFVALTGDYGEDTPSEFPSGGAMWPSASPNVLAVGGTTLTVSSNGTYVSEDGWTYNDNNPSENANGSSNGGPSAVQSEPQVQESVQTSGAREVPDVAYNAGNRVDVYDTSAPGGPWFGGGGTSAGAPEWAAPIARVDQGRLANGEAARAGNRPILRTADVRLPRHHDRQQLDDDHLHRPSLHQPRLQHGHGTRHSGPQCDDRRPCNSVPPRRPVHRVAERSV